MVSVRVLSYGVLMLLVVLFGVAGAYLLGRDGGFSQKMDLLNAVYFTITTLSTVGYGDIVPVTSLAKIFTIILIVSGLGVFLGAITIISGEFMNQRVEKLTGRISSIEKRILKNHILLIGTGDVNKSLAEKMRKLSKSFVIITANKTDADKLKDAGYRAFVADTTSESDLAEFVIGRSKGVVIDLGDPSLTVYTFLIVNNLAKNVKTFVIAQNDDVERHLSELGRVPNEFIINPNKIVAKDIMVKI